MVPIDLNSASPDRMLSACRVEIEAYGRWITKAALTGRADHLLQEVRLRLRHLEWLYARCMELDATLERAARSSLPPEDLSPVVLKPVFRELSIRESDPEKQATLPFQPQDELWISLEAFYYSAHRIRDILQDNKQVLPGLHTFEAIGVRTARNHLIEHTDDTGGVLVPSIACGGPVGPQLRALRWSHDPEGSHDPGLRVNAAEFAVNLHAVLRRAQGAA